MLQLHVDFHVLCIYLYVKRKIKKYEYGSENIHLRVITSRSRPFCKYHNALCLGGNFEAIHTELIGRRELGKQYCCAPGHNINNSFIQICLVASSR